jgi:VanZ family protein
MRASTVSLSLAQRCARRRRCTAARALVPATLCAAAILLASALPTRVFVPRDVPAVALDLLEYAFHFGAFFVLTLVVLRLRPRRPAVAAIHWLPLAVIAGVAIGSELLQFLTRGRTPSVSDFIADLVGAALAFLVVVRGTRQ